MFFPSLQAYLRDLDSYSQDISDARKDTLRMLGKAISNSIKSQGKADLVFICTHNSRRSHFGQIWADTAAQYYGINNISTYSGGTEATAFNTRSGSALERAGFSVSILKKDRYNPHYILNAGDPGKDHTLFSKKYDESCRNIAIELFYLFNFLTER